MGITEISSDIKRAVGGNGMYLLLGGGALLLIVYLLSKGDSGSNLTVATGYSAYPDAVTNANVIIGEVNDHTTNELSLLKNQLEDTSSLLQEGDNSILEMIDTSTESITDKISTSTENMMNKSTENTASIINVIDKNTNDITTGIDSLSSQVTNTSAKVSTVNNTVNKTYQTLKQKATNKSSASKTASKNVKYFNKITSYKGNSFVDALKKRGVSSSFSYRKKIAKANGIKNYTGTAKQNYKLLNLMKKGKLIKP